VPVLGQKFVEPGGGVIGDPGKHVFQPGRGAKSFSLTVVMRVIDHRGPLTDAVASREHSSLLFKAMP
jgi:hypothetical protein